MPRRKTTVNPTVPARTQQVDSSAFAIRDTRKSPHQMARKYVKVSGNILYVSNASLI